MEVFFHLMLYLIIQVLSVLFLPWLLTRLTRRLGTEDWLSPVVLCYLAGIVICNFTPLPLDETVTKHLRDGSILFAIPLMLYSTDLFAWTKLAKSTLIAFGLLVFSVLASSCIIHFFFKNQMPESWLTAGMLSGVFIGGTANMNAVGIALEASDATFIRLNAVEVACGGIFLVFMTTAAHRAFGWFLPEFKGDKHAPEVAIAEQKGFPLKYPLLGIGLTLLLIAATVGVTLLLHGTLEKPGFIILSLTALSLAASFVPAIRLLPGAYETGEYFLLMFSVAIGLSADFSEIFSGGTQLFFYTGSYLLLSVGMHLALCRLFRIDRDTMIITNVSGIYGPAFIGQIAAVIKNRSLVFSGIAMGLLGIAIANFLGVALANFLRGW